MNLKASLFMILSLFVLTMSSGLEASAASRCKSKILEGTTSKKHPLKDLVLNKVAQDYLQKRADLASESHKEQALIVSDLKLRADQIFDEITQKSSKTLEALDISSLTDEVIHQMKARDLHYLEERRLLHFYENLIGYLTYSFRWKIKLAQSRRFLNGTQQDAEEEFITEAVNDQIVRVFLQGSFDRLRNDVESEKAKFFFLSLVLSGKVRDALRKHLGSTRTSEKPQFSIDITFDLRAKIAKAQFDPELASKIQRSLNQLRPHEREIIELVYYRGLTLAQTANHLDQKLGTLKSKLSRTLVKLRALWGHESFD